MRPRAACAAAGLAALLAGVLATPARTLEAPRVVAVELRAEAGWSPPEGLGGLVAVEVGAPLDPEQIRRSARSLRAAVEASEVEAHLRRRPDGVEVVFALWTQARVAAVHLGGQPCFKPSRLFELIDQRPAAPLSESRLLRGLYRLQDLHREAGYREARIRLDVDHADSGQAIVTYDFDCGRPATVASVAFDGDLGPFSQAELAERLPVGAGARLWESAVREAAELLEDRLVGEGFRLARVGEPAIEFDAEAAAVDLVYPVAVGPRFEVWVSGVDATGLERAGVLPLQGPERFDEALLARDLGRLRRHFQELGHYRVEVDASTERGDRLRRIVVRVEPGPVYELESVAWEPMTAIPESRLETLVETTAKRRFRGRRRLIDQVLDQDLAAVRSYLALRGFDRARVGPAVVEESGSRLAVRVPVEEGPQRRVVNIVFRGVEHLAEPEARRLLRLREGGPFHPLLLDQSLNSVRARYEELGYTRVQATASLDWNDDNTLADVEIQVLEGPRTVVEQVILRGNTRTESAPILRAAGLERGDKVSRGDLLRVQRRLYGLGIFSSVDVRLAPGAPLTGRRDVIVRVEEGKSRRVSYGVGWDSEDGARAIVGFSHGNLLRRAVDGRIDLRWSQRDQLVRALIHQPFLGRFELPTTASLFAVEEIEESFTSKRRGFQLESSRLYPRSRINLLYTYKIVEIEPDAAFAALDPAELSRVLDIDRDLQEVALSSLRPGWLVDRRDDPVQPRRGWSSNLSAEYAFPFLSTDAEFVKGFSQQTVHRDLGRLGVAVASLRLGAIEPLAGRAPGEGPGALPSRRVPISERFFAGGRTSHRAYRRDLLGIPGDTLVDSDGALVPVGGNGLMLANLDWRFPIAGPVGGVAFVDAGNVWSDWRKIDPGELKPGAGVGVRYDSPIGPLRLEVGWKLDRLPGESPAVVFLSFGNPF